VSDLDRYLPSIGAGDADAFGHWVAGAEPRVRGSLLRFAAQVDVEALVQECLLRVWQVAARVEPDGRPDALLRLSIRIARNLAISELRRQGARPEVLAAMDHDDPGASTDVAPPDPLLRRLIAACRDALPRKPGEVLALRLADGPTRSDRDLAAVAGMKLNTFLQNFGRARKLLAACLRQHGVDLEAELS
jgi:RNA polymerase sigma-70 factor (ECF subfamily)